MAISTERFRFEGRCVQGSGWWWYPLVLAAVGVAAYVVIRKTSGDDGPGAGAAAAAAGLASSSNQFGSAKAAEPSSREVRFLLSRTATSEHISDFRDGAVMYSSECGCFACNT